MKNVRVLLIDSGETLAVFRTINTGRMEQFDFTHAPTVARGLNALEREHFHVVLVNLSLSGVFAFNSILKILMTASNVPVIALANENESSKTAEALRLGMDDYVLKGCSCDYLTRSLVHAIERKKLTTNKKQARPVAATGSGLTAHLSHECRNALACIHQFGTILIDGLAGSVSDEQREYLCIMIENASKIRNVLDQTLEGSEPEMATSNENN